ncbi:hypothetical protein GCM10010350_54760 [Streptomyces galilaeus]|nr:hypothetical protein GCM10010350_54760 [Streptomyces galilaeus]
MPDAAVRDGAALLLRPGAVGVAGAASDALSDPAEHPAVARANRQASPAVGLRKLLIVRMHPLS